MTNELQAVAVAADDAADAYHAARKEGHQKEWANLVGGRASEGSIVYTMTNAEYHTHPAIGSSGLKLILRSPLHYWARYVDPNREPEKRSESLIIGEVFHAALLEPEVFVSKYTRIPDGLDRRTKEGKALWAEIEAYGKVPLKPDDYSQILQMTAAAREHPVTSILNAHPQAMREVSFFWRDDETQVICKFRPDLMIPPCELFPNGFILDIKSAVDASPEGFAKAVWNYDYHISAAWYCEGFQKHYGTNNPPSYVWFAQEKDRPYAGAYYQAGTDVLNHGSKLAHKALRIFAESKRTGIWNGYSDQVTTLEPPIWAQREIAEAK